MFGHPIGGSSLSSTDGGCSYPPGRFGYQGCHSVTKHCRPSLVWSWNAPFARTPPAFEMFLHSVFKWYRSLWMRSKVQVQSLAFTVTSAWNISSSSGCSRIVDSMNVPRTITAASSPGARSAVVAANDSGMVVGVFCSVAMVCLDCSNSKSKARRLKAVGLAFLLELSSVAQLTPGWRHGPGMFSASPGPLVFLVRPSYFLYVIMSSGAVIARIEAIV